MRRCVTGEEHRAVSGTQQGGEGRETVDREITKFKKMETKKYSPTPRGRKRHRGRKKRAATVETAKNPRAWRTEEIWLLREIYPCLPDDEVAERLERHTAEDVASLASRLNLKKLPRPAEGGDGTDAAVPPEAP